MFRKLDNLFSKGNYVALTSLEEVFEVGPCLHCHLSVRLLCPFPDFVFSSAAKANQISCFVANFSSALSPIPLSVFSFFHYLSLWSIFLCSVFSSLSKPYLRICFVACLASSSSPSIGKSHTGVCRAPGYTFAGPEAFLCNSSYCASSCIGGKGSSK